MQLNLSNTTHSLEIETSIAGNIHYQVGYTDITSTNVSIPTDNVNIITTASVNTIVTAPTVSTTRKIQYLNIYNNGINNTITIKKDISGVKHILLKVSLQNQESLRIVNDKISLLDSGGREKTQNTGDNEIQGESRVIFKVGTTPEAAGQYYCFAKDTGAPGAWSVGTPGLNGRNTDGTTAADLGCVTVGVPSTGNYYLRDMDIGASQPGMFILADVLWVNTGLNVTTLTAQTITQPTLPLRDNTGTSNGFGIGAGILVTGTTTNAAIINNITLQYTNSQGVSGRTGTMSFPQTAVIGTFVPFQLQAGDVGVRSIQSITLNTSLGGGSISLICFNFMATTSVALANVGNTGNKRNLDLRLYNGHCLLPFWLASNTTALNITGGIYFINK